MITQDQVDEARILYEHLLEQFLLDRGWVKDSWSWYNFEVGRGMLTTDEAYYCEIMKVEEND